jgi:hypothetical protein
MLTICYHADLRRRSVGAPSQTKSARDDRPASITRRR